MKKLKKKAFIIVEVLAVIVILAILTVLIIPNISTYLKAQKDDYNDKMSKQLKLAAKNYFSENRYLLPNKSSAEIWKYEMSYVTASTLLSNNYLTKELTDADGRNCENSYVSVVSPAGLIKDKYYSCINCQGTDGTTATYYDDETYCKIVPTSDSGKVYGPTCSTKNDKDVNLKVEGATFKQGKYIEPTSIKIESIKSKLPITIMVTNLSNFEKVTEVITDSTNISNYDIMSLIDVDKIDSKNNRYSIQVGNTTGIGNCFVIEFKRYEIIYNANSPSGTTTTNVPAKQTKIEDKSAKISEQIPENTKYAFLGWTTTDDKITYDETTNKVSGTWYDPEDTYDTNKNITLYAQWYDLDSLEKSITSSVHSGDIHLKSAATVASGSVGDWTNGSVAPNLSPDSGYKAITNGTPWWSVGDGGLFAYKAVNSSLSWRNAAKSNRTSTRQVSILEVRNRKPITRTGTVNQRIIDLQNEEKSCLSYLAADGDLKIRSASQSISIGALGNKSFTIGADSGYSPIALLGYDLDGGSISYFRFYKVGNYGVYINNSHNDNTKSATLTLDLFETRAKAVGTATTITSSNQPSEGQKYYEALEKLKKTERTELFKASDCGSASVAMAQNSTSVRSAAVSGHDRVLGPTGYNFYNSASGEGASYSVILAMRMSNPTTVYVQHTGVYRSSKNKRYSPSAVNCQVELFVIDKH